MILKALTEYYEKSGALAPLGWEYRAISFAIVIDLHGHFVRIEDMRTTKNAGKSCMVPKAVSRTAAISANYLWDNVEYVLGFTDAESKLDTASVNDRKKLSSKIEKARKKRDAFRDKCLQGLQGHETEALMNAIRSFYDQKQYELVKQDSGWQEIEKKMSVNITFRINHSKNLIFEERGIAQGVNATMTDEPATQGICLISGERAGLVNTTTATPVLGGQPVGKLVACQVSSGYDSYGKSQGGNAPISVDAEGKYTAALNHLLRNGSRNKFVVGKKSYTRTFVFWASNSQAGKDVEDSFFSLLSFNADDDPNRGVENVHKVLKAVYSGQLGVDTSDKFFFLGLAPNSARIAVVYWHECSLQEFCGSLLAHFNDMDIADTRKERRPFSGIYSMLANVSLQNKASEAPPNLPEAIFKSVVQHLPYPSALFQACMRRIRAEQKVTIGRAAIIKAYLNRLNNNPIKLDKMLNKDIKDPGYLCGRLFATLEKLQENANGKSNMAERYMNTATTSPAAVFPNLLNLSIHHESKCGKPVYFQKLKAEIIGKLEGYEFPTRLDLQQQGRFMVGYYQQRQDFFTKKDNKETENNE